MMLQNVITFYVAMVCTSHAIASDTPNTLRVRSFKYIKNKPPMWMSLRDLEKGDTSDGESATQAQADAQTSSNPTSTSFSVACCSQYPPA